MQCEGDPVFVDVLDNVGQHCPLASFKTCLDCDVRYQAWVPVPCRYHAQCVVLPTSCVTDAFENVVVTIIGVFVKV
jgi:hypothetical protein